jgi:GNAT superfamily N-acetyltransferase
MLSRPDDVARYLEAVRAAADGNREALGFLPEGAYREAAEQEKLLVAVAVREGAKTYAGHLLFGGVFPHARIFQVYVAPEFRRQGIGRRLVETVLRQAEMRQYLSVSAKVADDLEANTFWETLQFELVRTKTGGRTTGRSINVRVRELETPRLLDLMNAERRPGTADLGMVERLSNRAPIYAIDLNVLFDVIKKRPRSEDAGRVIRASFNNLVRLSVTEEFIGELERTSKPSPSDPILELASKLPVLRSPPEETVQRITSELAALVFPDRAARGALSDQDQSDLGHLAIAIHHKVAGFITGEKAILRARNQLLSKYFLDVVGVTEFAENVEPATDGEFLALQAASSGQAIQAMKVGAQEHAVAREFLGRMRVAAQQIDDVLAEGAPGGCRKVLVRCEGASIALACWDVPSSIRPQIEAFVCADEDHPAVEIAVDYLLESICRESIGKALTLVLLRLLPGFVLTRRIALGHGFRPAVGDARGGLNLRKVCVGQAVTATTWKTFSQLLRRVAGIGVSDTPPRFEGFRQPISVSSPSGGTVTVPLKELETLLSPVLLLLPGRSGSIVPIRRRFAAELLGGSPQLSLIAYPEAILLRERVYFSSPRTAAALSEGTPILFYESAKEGGRASIIAAARVVRSERVSKDAVGSRLSRRGVLDPRSLRRITAAPTLAATTFDSIILFQKPMPLCRLRQIGCASGANLVTSRRISPEHLMRVVEEGLN